MKTIRLLRKFLIVLFVVAVFQPLFAGYFTYNLENTPYVLWKKDNASLKILSVRDWKYYLFGVYKRPLSFLSGKFLYLFPNYNFVITKWCDLCREEVEDQGTFKIYENKIVFKSKYKNRKRHFLIDVNGSYQKLNFFVIGDEKSIDSFLLVPDNDLTKLNNDVRYYGYFERTVQYLDWEDDLNRILTKGEKEDVYGQKNK